MGKNEPHELTVREKVCYPLDPPERVLHLFTCHMPPVRHPCPIIRVRLPTIGSFIRRPRTAFLAAEICSYNILPLYSCTAVARTSKIKAASSGANGRVNYPHGTPLHVCGYVSMQVLMSRAICARHLSSLRRGACQPLIFNKCKIAIDCVL